MPCLQIKATERIILEEILQTVAMSEVELTADNVDSFKVAELRAFLTERGLSSSGVKSVLVARLREALEGVPGDDDAEVDILGDETAAPPRDRALRRRHQPIRASGTSRAGGDGSRHATTAGGSGAPRGSGPADVTHGRPRRSASGGDGGADG